MNYIGNCTSLRIEERANTADAVRIKVEKAIDGKTTYGERDKNYRVHIKGPKSYRDIYDYSPSKK